MPNPQDIDESKAKVITIGDDFFTKYFIDQIDPNHYGLHLGFKLLSPMFQWIATMQLSAGSFRDESYIKNDRIDPAADLDEFNEKTETLLDKMNSATDETAPQFLKDEKPNINEVMGGFLAKNSMTAAFENAGKGPNKAKNQATFYVDYVEPMLSDDGKVYKQLMTNYGKNHGLSEADAKARANELYKEDVNNIKEVVKNSPELRSEINKLIKDSPKLQAEFDKINSNKEIKSNEPAINEPQNNIAHPDPVSNIKKIVPKTRVL